VELCLYMRDGGRKESLTLQLRSLGHEAVDGPSARAWALRVWIVDAADDGGARRLWTRDIPAHAWTLVIAPPALWSEVLSEGADDVLSPGASREEVALRLAVAEAHCARPAEAFGSAGAAAQTLPGLVAQLDSTGAIVWVNAEFLRLLGVERASVTGQRLRDLAHPEDAVLADLLDPALARLNSSRTVNVRMRRAHGGTLWVAWRLTLSALREGVLAVGTDVSETHRAQSELATARELLELALQNHPEPLVAVGKDGTVWAASAASAALLGRDRDALRGQPLDNLLSERQAPSSLPAELVVERGRARLVHLALPSALCPAQATAPRPASSVPAAPEPPLALVIDDDDGLRTVAQRMLRFCGMRVACASSGFEGVELFRSHAHDVVLVLLDMVMSGMDGEQTFDAIRAIKPDAPVVLMSGFSRQETVDGMLARGLDGFVEKPLRLEVVREWVQRKAGASGG
jgi:PAS domain S-box-containing protein